MVEIYLIRLSSSITNKAVSVLPLHVSLFHIYDCKVAVV